MVKKTKREYIVECSITGTASVFVEAYSEEEAIAAANNGDGEGEINEWTIREALSAEVNE